VEKLRGGVQGVVGRGGARSRFVEGKTKGADFERGEAPGARKSASLLRRSSPEAPGAFLRGCSGRPPLVLLSALSLSLSLSPSVFFFFFFTAPFESCARAAPTRVSLFATPGRKSNFYLIYANSRVSPRCNFDSRASSLTILFSALWLSPVSFTSAQLFRPDTGVPKLFCTIE
jgi:hypothetical protein